MSTKKVLKKDKYNFKTHIRNGKRLMICRNSIEDTSHWSWEHLKDKPRCKRWSEVGMHAVAVLCDLCTQHTVPAPEPKRGHVSKGRARGWQFMQEFVDPDGNVFYKGVEQPQLKGTLQPTPNKAPSKKLTKREKEELKDQILQQIVFTRGQVKNAQFKKDIKAGNSTLRRLQRELKKLN
jgi:hypothetical protein